MRSEDDSSVFYPRAVLDVLNVSDEPSHCCLMDTSARRDPDLDIIDERMGVEANSVVLLAAGQMSSILAKSNQKKINHPQLRGWWSPSSVWTLEEYP